jgi:hypothetical protein
MPNDFEAVERGTQLRFRQTALAGLQGNLVRLILGAAGSLGMLIARIFSPIVRR